MSGGQMSGKYYIVPALLYQYEKSICSTASGNNFKIYLIYKNGKF